MRSPITIGERAMSESTDSSVIDSLSQTTIESFEVSRKPASLQEAFLKFRKWRQKELKNARIMEEKAIETRSESAKMGELRRKFLEGCKKYFGVPYAKRYHDPGSPMYESRLFLDCCGLVRQVLRDLKEDFGFRIGPWNQSYMFDTLPVDVENIREMKPGDLVFISGTYFNPKAKKQKHDMVHVEVWLGEGEKTIGARWQKGKVQVFDSYKFVSKSYHSMKYHFKSIDTWLTGICKSFCPEHLWRASRYMPGKKSIFSLEDMDDIQDEAACDVDNESGDEKNTSDGPDHEKGRLDGDQNCIKRIERFDGQLQNSFRQTEKIAYVTLLKEQSTDNSEREKSCEQTQNVDLNLRDLSITEGRSFYKDKSLDILEPCREDKTIVYQTYSELSSREKDFVENYNCGQNIHVDEKNIVTNMAKSRTCYQELRKMGTEDYLNASTCSSSQFESCGVRACIHGILSRDSYNEQTDCDLASCSELSTSLECFEVVSYEVENTFQCCPLDSQSDGSNGGNRKSTSPMKETKRDESGSSNSSTGRGSDDSSDNNSGSSPLDSPRTKAQLFSYSRQPGFYIGGGNGNWMIESALIAQGWRKIEDKNDMTFKLKWVECKSQINYNTFREGEQLVNHISNINLLTTKMGLLTNLQEYQRVLEKTSSKQRFLLSDFFPEAHCLLNVSAKMKFIEDIYKDGETWICKPTGLNQGKGIYIIGSLKQLKERLLPATDESPARPSYRIRPAQERIIQRYITNPLLLDKRKFDIRAYMLIASTQPYIVLYHPGYVRLACVPYTPYSPDTGDLHAHLTNQYVQKKSPLYQSMKEDTVWDFHQLQAYIDKHYTNAKGLPNNWVFTCFTRRMQQIMLTCFQSVKLKLNRRRGTFDLLGFDFMIDDDFKVWLIEINVNPALHTNCQVLKDMLPNMVDETLKTVLEIFEKSKKNVSILPLQSGNGFRVLYSGRC